MVYNNLSIFASSFAERVLKINWRPKNNISGTFTTYVVISDTFTTYVVIRITLRVLLQNTQTFTMVEENFEIDALR